MNNKQKLTLIFMVSIIILIQAILFKRNGYTKFAIFLFILFTLLITITTYFYIKPPTKPQINILMSVTIITPILNVLIGIFLMFLTQKYQSTSTSDSISSDYVIIESSPTIDEPQPIIQQLSPNDVRIESPPSIDEPQTIIQQLSSNAKKLLEHLASPTKVQPFVEEKKMPTILVLGAIQLTYKKLNKKDETKQVKFSDTCKKLVKLIANQPNTDNTFTLMIEEKLNVEETLVEHLESYSATKKLEKNGNYIKLLELFKELFPAASMETYGHFLFAMISIYVATITVTLGTAKMQLAQYIKNYAQFTDRDTVLKILDIKNDFYKLLFEYFLKNVTINSDSKQLIVKCLNNLWMKSDKDKKINILFDMFDQMKL